MAALVRELGEQENEREPRAGDSSHDPRAGRALEVSDHLEWMGLLHVPGDRISRPASASTHDVAERVRAQDADRRGDGVQQQRPAHRDLGHARDAEQGPARLRRQRSAVDGDRRDRQAPAAVPVRASHATDDLRQLPARPGSLVDTAHDDLRLHGFEPDLGDDRRRARANQRLRRVRLSDADQGRREQRHRDVLVQRDNRGPCRSRRHGARDGRVRARLDPSELLRQDGALLQPRQHHELQRRWRLRRRPFVRRQDRRRFHGCLLPRRSLPHHLEPE